jgi:hypothetical protein
LKLIERLAPFLPFLRLLCIFKSLMFSMCILYPIKPLWFLLSRAFSIFCCLAA